MYKTYSVMNSPSIAGVSLLAKLFKMTPAGHQNADILFISPHDTKHLDINRSIYQDVVFMNFEGYPTIPLDTYTVHIGYTLKNDENNFYMPNWPIWFNDACKFQHIAMSPKETMALFEKKNRFCGMVNRNIDHHDKNGTPFDGVKYRMNLLTALQGEGRDVIHMNRGNIPRDVRYEQMGTFMFEISMENGYRPRYVTEKLMNSFLAGNIPIYYGNMREAVTHFNKDRFISAVSEDGVVTPVDEMRDKVLSMYANKKLCQDILAQPVFNKNMRIPFSWLNELFDFAQNRLGLERR